MLGFRARRMAAAALLALVGLLSVPSSVPAAAASAPSHPTHSAHPATRCLSDNGTNVARYFGLRGRDVLWPNIQGIATPCLTVVKGNTFVRAHGWFTQLPSRAVYPEGYVPDHPDPIQDFLSKLTASRYVISRDGKVELTRTVTGPELLDHAHMGQFGDLFVAPDTTLVPGVEIQAESPEWTTLEPFDSRRLPVGEHTVEVFWTMSEPHCDGFDVVPAINCLPAGETLTAQNTFTVVRPS